MHKYVFTRFSKDPQAFRESFLNLSVYAKTEIAHSDIVELKNEHGGTTFSSEILNDFEGEIYTLFVSKT